MPRLGANARIAQRTKKENASSTGQLMMDKSEKIFVAGHRGMVGSALVRRLKSEGFSNLLVRDRSKLDLKDDSAVAKFFAEEKPPVVILAAAKVGGIKANNDFPDEFLLENLGVQKKG